MKRIPGGSRAVLVDILTDGPMSPADIARITGFTPGTVASAISLLRGEKHVVCENVRGPVVLPEGVPVRVVRPIGTWERRPVPSMLRVAGPFDGLAA